MYVNITRKWVLKTEFLLNLTLNKTESDIKNSTAPTTVIIVAKQGTDINLNIAKEFMVPFINK